MSCRPFSFFALHSLSKLSHAGIESSYDLELRAAVLKVKILYNSMKA